MHTIALHKARKLQVTSPVGSRLTYLQFAGKFTGGVIANCLQLQVILCEIAGIFACDCAGIFSCVCSCFCLRLCGYFFLRLQLFLPAIVRVFFPRFAVIFACVWRVFLPAILVLLSANCMHFCLQKQAILHASRRQVCMSSACKITFKTPVVFR